MKTRTGIALIAGLVVGTTAYGQGFPVPDPVLYTQNVVGADLFAPLSIRDGSTCTGIQVIADDVEFDTDVKVTSITWWGRSIVCAGSTVSRFGDSTEIFVEIFANATSTLGFDVPGALLHSQSFSPGDDIQEIGVAGTIEGNAGFQNRVFLSRTVDFPGSQKIWISITALTKDQYFWTVQYTGTDDPEAFGSDGEEGKAQKRTGDWTAVASTSTSISSGGQAFSLEGFEVASVDSDNDGLDDATEIDLQSTLTCLDINNPDSDGDGLLDGFEVNIVGTNPCKVDTDGDGIPDILDLDSSTLEDPSEQALFAQSVANAISLADLQKFLGPNDNAKSARRNVLTSRMDEAASLISQEMYAEALEVLNSVLVRVDGDQSPPDWITDEVERAFVEELVLFTIGLIS